MKKVILLLTLFFTAAVFAQTENVPLTSGCKIGYVDSEVIMSQYSLAVKAKSDLDAMMNQWKKETDSMTTSLQQLYADYQKQSNTMKPDEQAKAQKNIVEKDQKLQDYKQQKFGQPNGEYYVKQDQLMSPVKQKIFQAIEEIAKEEKMQYVLDKAGEVIVLYADPQFDITFKVLDRLKRGK